MESGGKDSPKVVSNTSRQWASESSAILGVNPAIIAARVNPPMPPQQRSAKVGGISVVHDIVPGEHSKSGKWGWMSSGMAHEL
mgnify:CR=1 FL=1